MPPPRKDGARYPNGRLIRDQRKPNGRELAPHWTTYRISAEDLAAARYPAGDVRNEPAVRQQMLEALARPFVMPPLTGQPVWTGKRTRCKCCGQLSHQ